MLVMIASGGGDGGAVGDSGHAGGDSVSDTFGGDDTTDY